MSAADGMEDAYLLRTAIYGVDDKAWIEIPVEAVSRVCVLAVERGAELREERLIGTGSDRRLGSGARFLFTLSILKAVAGKRLERVGDGLI